MRDEFLITRKGKKYVLYAGLLDEAHDRGLRGIDTELVQVPDDSNGSVAIVKATAEMDDGRRFSGIGDASPENVGRNIVPHLIRMAETRAKARALRDAVNVGATALEELSDGDDAPTSSGFDRSSGGSDGATPIRGSRQDRQRSRQAAGASADDADAPASGNTNGRGQEEAAPPGGDQGSRKGGGSRTGSRTGSRAGTKARKSQVDLLRTLAVEWAGDGGVERLEGRVGKPLTELSRAEADEWIDRLTPEGRE